jgi:hypothetical protein
MINEARRRASIRSRILDAITIVLTTTHSRCVGSMFQISWHIRDFRVMRAILA